jgi:cardiolipin synthase A/B
MMIEIDDHAIAKCLARDFKLTWQGVNQSQNYLLGDSNLYFFSGSKSKSLYNEFFEEICAAKKSVSVISPYISEPLFSILKKVSQKGVKVKIVSPKENNKSIFKQYVESEAAKGYFELFNYPGMSHLKAILIDDERLIFGSSNYDLVSYYFEQEVVMVSSNSHLVSLFVNEVMIPTMKDSSRLDVSAKTKSAVPILMKALNFLCKYSSQTILKPY